MRHRTYSQLLSSTVLALALLAPSTAFAQADAVPPGNPAPAEETPPTTGPADNVTDIVVTAQRRSEKIYSACRSP